MITLKMDRLAAEKVLELIQEHQEEPIRVEHDNAGSWFVTDELQRQIFLERFEAREKK